MQIIKKLTVDLAHQSLPVQVDAVRGDSAIWLEFNLLCCGQPWEMPIGATAVVRYRLSAGTGGEYDTVDNQRAWQREGNLLRIALAPQVCSATGETAVQVAIVKDGKQISTFPIVLNVVATVTGSGQPEDYTNLAQWLKYNTAGGSTNLGDIEDRLEALEALSATHVTEEEVRRIINDDPWQIPTYNGEMEDV